MTDRQRMIEDWMERNRGRMVHCQAQPGNLLISKQSCIARRARARTEDLTNILKGDYQSYVYRTGLSICLGCKEAA